jgi:Na+-driven multidrug efflux pump
LLGIGLLVSASFNASGQPLRAAKLNLIRLFGLAVPLAYLGSHLHGLLGIFLGITLANSIAGLLALLMVSRFLAATRRQFAAAQVAADSASP